MMGQLTEPVFSVGAARYDWADVLLAAHLRGDWALLEAQIRQGLACQRAVDEDEEADEADPDAVAAAAAEFRYARDLVSAEEAEAWLSAHGLTAEAWMDCIERRVLREEHAAELDALVERYPATDDEVAALTWVEGVCSGRLAEFAHALAARAVLDDTSPPTLAPIPALSIPGIPAELGRERLERLARLELAYERARTTTVTADRVRRELAAHWLEWVSVRTRYVIFTDEQAAREALLSVRDDGLDLDEVAAEVKVEVQCARAYLDALAPALRGPLLAAASGDVIGPVPLDGSFAVFVVDDKLAPSTDDPEVRARAEVAILGGLLEREVADRVRWHAPL